MFSWIKSKRGSQSEKGSAPQQFVVGSVTLDHACLLRDIGSPWAAPFVQGNTHAERRAALAAALTHVTVEELAEFAYAISRPATESRAVLSRGREVFAASAMEWVLQQVPRSQLELLVANGGQLLVGAVPKEGRSDT
jgi:hypothetical protein